MLAISKLLIKKCSLLSMLSWKCIGLVDQEWSGQGQPIWATPPTLQMGILQYKIGG